MWVRFLRSRGEAAAQPQTESGTREIKAWRLVTTGPYKKRSQWGPWPREKPCPVQRGQARLSSRQWHPQETCQIVQFLRRISELVLSMKSLDFFQYWLFPLLNTGQAKRNVFGPAACGASPGPQTSRGRHLNHSCKALPLIISSMPLLKRLLQTEKLDTLLNIPPIRNAFRYKDLLPWKYCQISEWIGSLLWAPREITIRGIIIAKGRLLGHLNCCHRGLVAKRPLGARPCVRTGHLKEAADATLTESRTKRSNNLTGLHK